MLESDRGEPEQRADEWTETLGRVVRDEVMENPAEPRVQKYKNKLS